jgi:hypothetical protein
MVALRLTCALLVGCVTTCALAAGRSASFTVSVQVVAPLRSRASPVALPPSFVGASRSVALPCGAAASQACAAAAAEARKASGATTPILATVLTDGAPTAIVER